tara:strand:- start:56 stop:334 length:279 start_codon:yes stop_codon:yes gene_type:complete
MKAKINKYGIWISEEEMRIIQNALELYHNDSYLKRQKVLLENSSCNGIPKIADVKNLRNDLSKIRENGVQIPKKVEIPNEDEVFNIQCEECD